ncbi:hypothetical protein K3165_09430 [Qipengyuania sp. 1XM1-15A]|uniref:hypothetical protein n=1 Tax=Qipengyuania xiamenensis TaxID=2867237 RepID=UPI001C880522|nr:hypothetical protein [Qipengyuania xiamenensis]MBX7533140.1 hypothetical protein [Qipengyuania xiamenensis]
MAAQAQYVDEPQPQREFTEAEIEAVPMPALQFDMAEANVDDFEKYFYFHRPETDFATAYYDITECDALASGISFYAGPTAGDMAANMLQYGVLAGGIGGAIGGLMADAIFGSGERRKQRRVNMRNCMFYKGYDRYGLEKDLWQEFNFEEGNSQTEATERENKLLMQARVASGPKPEQGRVEP